MKSNLVPRITGIVALLALAACNTTRDPVGAASREIELFNGKNLQGWKAVPANATEQGTWTVRDGMIICTGEPVGFICTDRSFTDFRMTAEYRWAPGAKPGNSGLFSRINDTRTALPRTIEVQLMHGNAGDVLGLQGMMVEKQDRFFEVNKHKLAGDIRGVRKTQNAEKPAGEWNKVEILAEGPTYTVWVNGEKVNTVNGVEVIAGPVGLQSEGGEVHFRNVMLTPLP
jgi:hypothetical protein